MHGLETIIEMNNRAVEKSESVNRAKEALRLVIARPDTADYVKVVAQEALRGLK